MEFNSGKFEEIQSDFQTLAAEILKPGNSYVLKTANRIYGEKTYPFHNKYLEDMKTYFGAEPQSVNFVEASGQIRKEINSWVGSQTGGKIPNLLPDDSVDTKTKMVLVNALYFKGTWEHQFSVKSTTERPFRVNKTTSKPVQMMSMKQSLQVFHIEELQTIGLQLHYQNRDLSLLLLLPEAIDGLEQLERAITYEKLDKWTSADMMDTYEVQLYLPKFKMEESYDLKSALRGQKFSGPYSKENNEDHLPHIYSATLDNQQNGHPVSPRHVFGNGKRKHSTVSGRCDCKSLIQTFVVDIVENSALATSLLISPINSSCADSGTSSTLTVNGCQANANGMPGRFGKFH
ncbi:serpin B10 isoform X2 [Mus musculus]|nr:serpin B10 isoform X2 [Mus musculus]|eukprot:XP_006529661.1 PREDICTED: serpin B10 isoform X2 [Mus musculus]